MLLSLHEDLRNNKHNELDKLIDGLEQSLDSKSTERFEKLDRRIAAISETIEKQSTLLESRFSGRAEPGSQVGEHGREFEFSIGQLTRQLDEKTEAIVNSFQSQITGILERLGDRLTTIPPATPLDEGNIIESREKSETVDPKVEEAANHWAQKKAAMLSKYGIDPEHRPAMEMADGEDAVEVDDLLTDVEVESPVDQPLESLHQSIDNMSEADAEKIAQLKAELTSKLRDAEVEIAINRAKLSQQKAELEAEKVELERRTSEIERKYAATQKSPEKNPGFVDRLARHLSKRDKRKR